MDTQILYDELYSESAALAAYQGLSAVGGRVFIVGGAVRDVILDKQPKDIDLMVTDLSFNEIKKALKSLPGHVTYAGKNFGVFHYHFDDTTVEVAMPRTETSTGEGHKDFAVNADGALSPQEDLGRRDFTANALAFDIDSGELIDPYNGSQDIQEGRLRLVNAQAFNDDPLRIVRALVAYAKHGLYPDEATLQSMTDNAQKITHLPAERIQQELDKLLSGSDPAGAIEIAHDTGVLQYVFPELDSAMGFDQKNRHHDLPVGEHCIEVLRKAATLSPDPDFRLAALLHDIGKPPTFWQDAQGAGHFYQSDAVDDSQDHADVGADMTDQLMKRLKYPNSRRQRVVNLVQHHMFPYFNSPKGARKFIQKAGDPDTAYDLMNLRESDASGKSSNTINDYDQEHIDTARALLDNVTSEPDQAAFSLKDLAINGSDLIQLGIQPGPQMKVILNDLLEDVIENPSLNSKDQLVSIVRELHDTETG